jgi:glycerol-3-phosphate acyltransferase PlsY
MDVAFTVGVSAFVFGYALGSIPFGLLLTRLAGLGDVRAIGSGNIGATNVLRAGSKWLAIATLLGDLLKGTVAVLLARYYLGTDASLIAGVGAFLGHLFPIWLGFNGGKGISTYIGVLLAIAWIAALAFGAIWLLVAALFRFSSLAGLVTSLATPIILAAGVYKLPDLLGHNGDGVRLQILAGSVAAGLAAYLSVRFLTRYFTTRTLLPFAIYCLVAGVIAIVRFA